MELDKIYRTDYKDIVCEIEDGSIDLVLTDPPYLFVKGGMKNKKFNIGKMASGSMVNARMSDFGEAKIKELLSSIKPKFRNGYNAYFFCSELQLVHYLDYAKENRLRYNVLVWDRQTRTMISKKFFRSNIDYIVRIYDKGKALNQMQDVDFMSMYSKIRVGQQGTETSHETEKNLDVVKDLIRLSSSEGDTIFDPFVGSGTTAVACMETGRHYVGCEIDEAIYEMAQTRIARKQAVPLAEQTIQTT